MRVVWREMAGDRRELAGDGGRLAGDWREMAGDGGRWREMGERWREMAGDGREMAGDPLLYRLTIDRHVAVGVITDQHPIPPLVLVIRS